MRICIAGAGAIGGWLGARLALAGRDEICALARGATLTALRERGWRLQSDGAWHQAPARASDQATELGVQDLVVIAVKGPSLTALAPQLAPLIGPHTLLVPAMNGVPFWFCHGVPGFEEPLASLDPGGAIERALPMAQVLGCVVHVAAQVAEPGCVEHRMGQRLILGEPAGGRSDRLDAACRSLGVPGVTAEASHDVRRDIWFKLWGNLTMNPVSALTGAATDALLADPLVVALCNAAMREARTIGERIGCRIDQEPGERHAVTRRLGAFKTSMLQDAEAGRPLELDAIVTAAHEIGARMGIEMPAIGAILGLTRLWARGRGLYPN